MTRFVRLDGPQSVAELESELGTPEGFARRVIVDRDLPKTGILLTVLGVIGLVIVVTITGWQPLWVLAPLGLILLGGALWLRAKATQPRVTRAAFERYRTRGYLAVQHGLDQNIYYQSSADSSADKYELVVLSTPGVSASELRAAIPLMRAAVAAMAKYSREQPRKGDALQAAFGGRETRYRGRLATELWPESPAGLVLITRHDGDALVVIDADPARSTSRRELLQIRSIEPAPLPHERR